MVVFSKLQTIPTSCFEYVHPWQTSCVDATLGLMVDSFQDSLRIYTTVYIFTLLMRGKKITKKTLKQTILGILQSTVFLTTHAYGYSTALCLLRGLLGRFDKYLVSFTPAFLSSLVAIHLERPSRRPLLCLYVTNVASETFFRMAVSRGLIRPIKHGEVAIFTLSTAVLLYLFRGEHSNDSMFSMLRFVIGKHEEYNNSIVEEEEEDEIVNKSSSTLSYHVIVNLLSIYRQYVHKLKSQPKHISCPHPYSCTYYSLAGLVKMFAVGYGIQTTLSLILSLRKIIKKPSTLPKVFTGRKSLSLGTFLGLFAGIFKGVSCTLRWASNGDKQVHAIPAALLAGCTFLFYPDTTAALYVMWKAFQILYLKAVEKGYLPEIPGGTVFLYCFSTAVLFHAAILEPQNLRPSYFRFLYSLSGGRIAAMSRTPIDEFGMGTSTALADALAKNRLDPKPAYRFKFFGTAFKDY